MTASGDLDGWTSEWTNGSSGGSSGDDQERGVDEGDADRGEERQPAGAGDHQDRERTDHDSDSHRERHRWRRADHHHGGRGDEQHGRHGGVVDPARATKTVRPPNATAYGTHDQTVALSPRL